MIVYEPKAWRERLTLFPKTKQAVKKEVDEAVELAKKSATPPGEMIWTNIYKETLGADTRGVDSRTKVKL